MVIEPVMLTGAVEDIHGLGMSVRQDHGGIRIDVGGIEIMLSTAQSQILSDAIIEARILAFMLQAEAADDE